MGKQKPLMIMIIFLSEHTFLQDFFFLPVLESFARFHQSLCDLQATVVALKYLTVWGQRSYSHNVPFQLDIQGHQSAAVKDQSKHFYSAPLFFTPLSPASCSGKIDILGVMLRAQQLFVPASCSIVALPINVYYCGDMSELWILCSCKLELDLSAWPIS